MNNHTNIDLYYNIKKMNNNNNIDLYNIIKKMNNNIGLYNIKKWIIIILNYII